MLYLNWGYIQWLPVRGGVGPLHQSYHIFSTQRHPEQLNARGVDPVLLKSVGALREEGGVTIFRGSDPRYLVYLIFQSEFCIVPFPATHPPFDT